MNQKEIEDILSAGIYEAGVRLAKYLVFCFFIGLCIVEGYKYLNGYYDSDSTDGHQKSNMMLHTDQLTGCQYLSGVKGGITPRIGYDGRHHGCKGL